MMTHKTESYDWWIAAAFSSNSLLLAVGSNLSRILIFDLQTKNQVSLQIEDKCTSLVFASNDLYLAAGNNKGKVWIFDIKTRDKVFDINTQTTTTIQRIIFSMMIRS